MQRSMYEYYSPSYLTLEAVLNHYVDNFYLKESSMDKVEKVKSKAIESPKMKELFEYTIKHRDFDSGIPTHTDFVDAIKSSPWFYLRSNKTKAVAVLAAAVNWSQTINKTFYIIDDEQFRNDILLVLKQYSIFEEMSDNEYHSMRKSGEMVKIFTNHGLDIAAKNIKALKFENELRSFIRSIINPLFKQGNELSDALNFAMGKQSSIPILHDYERQLYMSAVEYADGARDMIRISNKYGIDWKVVANEEIEKMYS